MTTQPAHDKLDRHPFWQVQSVFDPDGGGFDFAYTIGLHDAGRPELHMWARPSEGEDPGDDWMFSNNDRVRILNEFAWLLLDHKIGVGSRLTRRYDDGLATVEFRIDPPGDRDQLEAYGIAPDAAVLPVRWSLLRPPEGPLTPLGDATAEAAAEEYAVVLAGLPGRGQAPPGWALPRDPSFDPHQRFGPRTPIVLARGAEFWQADDETICHLISAAIVAGSASSGAWANAVASARARPAGRRTAVEEACDAAHELAGMLTQAPNQRGRWQRILRALVSQHPLDVAESMKDRDRAYAHQLGKLMCSLFVSEAVADLVDPDLCRSTRGPWLSGLRGLVACPGPEWSASAEVLAQVRELLEPLDSRTLAKLARAHESGLLLRSSAYAHIGGWLVGQAITSACACPWDSVLSGLPGCQGPAWASQAPGTVAALLEDFASVMTAAITYRARLSNDEVDALTMPFVALLPGLEATLNSPI